MDFETPIIIKGEEKEIRPILPTGAPFSPTSITFFIGNPDGEGRRRGLGEAWKAVRSGGWAQKK